MCSSGSNEAPMMIGVAKSFKSLMFNLDQDIKEHEEQVEDNQVGILVPKGGPTNKGCSSTLVS